MTSRSDAPFYRSPRMAPGRWRGLGPWQCMFPIDFAAEAVLRWTVPGEVVFDPFCGRGTAPFAAQVLGRRGFGCDINPAAWVFAATKARPFRFPAVLLRRAREVAAAVTRADRRPTTEFQKFAWSRPVLGFLNAARRELDWRDNRCDRTLMAFLLHDLHGHAGRSLSNQMRPGIALAPDYSVRWWRSRRLQPPGIDPLLLLEKRLAWRYKKGVPPGPEARLMRGDSRSWLPRVRTRFRLLVTSPPYRGVADYQKDQWLRLWLLGERGCTAYGESTTRFASESFYEDFLREIFRKARRRAAPGAVILVRTDSRPATLTPTRRTLREVLEPEWVCSETPAPGRSGVPLNPFGRRRAKEIDLLFLPAGHAARNARVPGRRAAA